MRSQRPHPLPLLRTILLALLLGACGMKGDLYRAPDAQPGPEPEGRKAIPATPEPARSQ